MSESDTRPPRGDGKKIAGLPRTPVIIGGVTMVLAVVYFLITRRKAAASASSTGSTGAADGTGVDYAGDISALQTEFGDLASELAAMQGQGGSSGGSAGGGLPGGGGPPSPGPPSTLPPHPGPRPGPRPRGIGEVDRHQDHMQHLAHERHLARLGRGRGQ